jgi:hypothetical protein
MIIVIDMQRSTHRCVTFARPFSLSDLDEIQPAGTYRIETSEVLLNSLSSAAYLRVATTIELPAVGTPSRSRQLVTIDPLELEAALNKDAAPVAWGLRQLAATSVHASKESQVMRLSEAVLTEELDRIIIATALRIEDLITLRPASPGAPASDAPAIGGMIEGLRRLKHYRAQFT